MNIHNQQVVAVFLTDINYSKKLKDMWEHRGSKQYELDDIMLLKIGRHLRPQQHFKMIIGREEGENNFLEGYRHQFVHLRVVGYEGPLVLIDGELFAEDIQLAARIIARYSAGRQASEVNIEVNLLSGVTHQLAVKPFTESEIQPEWYV